jgi:hypothetical protein
VEMSWIGRVHTHVRVIAELLTMNLNSVYLVKQFFLKNFFDEIGI